MYGVINSTQLKDTAVYVCDILGHGKNKKAVNLLLETAAAETAKGTIKDRTKFAGIGLMQFDKVGFDDVKARIRFADAAIIKDKMDIVVEWVEWEDLRYNPLLSLLFTRLKYKKVVEEIPNSIEGRALYWKVWYNSYHPNAKGSISHYLEANKRHIG